MFSDKITYEDFNGNTVEEEVFFNISKMEALELEASYPHGYASFLEKVAQSDDNLLALKAFKDLVKLAYGVKSEDGKRFVKSDEEYEKFESSPVYDEVVIKLISDGDYALDFVLGAFPNSNGETKEAIQKQIEEAMGDYMKPKLIELENKS